MASATSSISDNIKLVSPSPTTPTKPELPSQARHRSKRWRFDLRAWKVYVPRTRWMITFAAITILQGLVGVILWSYLIAYFLGSLVTLSYKEWQDMYHELYRLGGNAPAMYTLAKGVVLGQAIIGIFEMSYQILLVLDAGRRKNIVQVIGVCLNNVSMLTLVAIALSGVRSSVELLDTVHAVEPGARQHIVIIYETILVLLALSTFSMAVVAWLGCREFEWSVYRHISSADTRLRRLYLVYEILVAMLHLDFFFLFGFWVQILVLQPRGMITPAFVIVNGFGLALTMLTLIMVAYAVRKESGRAAIAATCLLVVEFGLLVGRLAYAEIARLPFGYQIFMERVLGYGIVAGVFLLATSIVAGCCWSNFNKGLKVYLQQTSLPGGEFGRDRARDFTVSGSQSQVLLHSRMDLE